MRIFTAVAVLLSGALLLPAAAAGGSGAYPQVLHVYQTHGSIPPCQFTSQQLNAALKGVDTYGQQYYADFITAIQTALEARASGVCSGAQPAGGGASGRGPGQTRLPPSVTSSTSGGVPAPIVLLAVVGGALALAAALAAVGRERGWEAWAGWRHGVAEATYRAGDSWAALVDRLRR